MNAEESVVTAPIRSMTGYAQVRKESGAGELTVSLRTVNHRGLDIHFHNASEFAVFENGMRAIIKQNIARGHVEVRVFLTRDAQAQTRAFNREMVARYVDVFYTARKEFGLSGELDLNVVLTLPGVFDAPLDPKPLDDAFGTELESAIGECVCELNAYREREASQLVKGLEGEITAIEQQAARISSIRSEVVPVLQARLRERLLDLLGGENVPESRVVEEAAVLADRSDVQEELTRLEVHARELRRILAGGGEIGKRLDFLLQEMNRETNTILSKTSGAGEIGLTITSLGLGIKANIERIREQALNLE